MGWEKLGGVLTSAPTVSSWDARRLDCFVRGRNNAMWYMWYSGSRWRGWENLGGILTSAPAAVSWGNRRIDSFVRGRNNAMWHKWYDGSRWRGWESLAQVSIFFIRKLDNSLILRWRLKFIVFIINRLYFSTPDVVP